jgi:hypothetical protein
MHLEMDCEHNNFDFKDCNQHLFLRLPIKKQHHFNHSQFYTKKNCHEKIFTVRGR